MQEKVAIGKLCSGPETTGCSPLENHGRAAVAAETQHENPLTLAGRVFARDSSPGQALQRPRAPEMKESPGLRQTERDKGSWAARLPIRLRVERDREQP